MNVLRVSVLMTVLFTACAVPSPMPPPQASQAIVPTSTPHPTVVRQQTIEANAVRGGNLIIGTVTEASTLQPLLSTDSPSQAYINLLYAPLVRVDPQTLEITGVLYEDKPMLTADGTKITWKLRQGLKWSDGRPLTTQDIVFTWQKMMDEKVKFPYRKTYQDAFREVQAVDDLTVDYILRTPGFCPALAKTGLVPPIPRHVFENLDINTTDVNNKPIVTSGPFRFKEWVRYDHLTASPAYEGFVRGKPYLDAVTYRVIPDMNVVGLQFRTQEIDVAATLSTDAADGILQLPHTQFVAFYPTIGASTSYLVMNLRNPFLADKIVRQAIALAIDKQKMIDILIGGFGKRQYSIYPASSWAAVDEKELPHYDYDPVKANQLLDAAGYGRGPDGIRVSKDGKPIRFRIDYDSGNKVREQMSLVVLSYLREIGIAADVTAYEYNIFMDRTRKGESDLYFNARVSDYDPSDAKNLYTTSGSQNFVGYSNPQVDNLFGQAETVSGCRQADRKAVYAQIQKIIAEDSPVVVMFTFQTMNYYNKRMNLLPLTSFGVMYDIEKIWIKP
jgi:peptide/nickel transport system substrate-binding protein